MGVVKFCVIAAAAAVSMLAAPGAASAEDKPAPKDNPAAATAIEYGKTAPGEKATIFDDGVKPVAPKPNPQGTVFDDLHNILPLGKTLPRILIPGQGRHESPRFSLEPEIGRAHV